MTRASMAKEDDSAVRTAAGRTVDEGVSTVLGLGLMQVLAPLWSFLHSQ